MAETEIHVGIVGMILRTTFVDQDGTAIDLSAPSANVCRISSPAGTVADKTAVPLTAGADGVYQYTTVAGDIDTHGKWQAQFHVVNATYDLWSKVEEFTVSRNLPAP